MDASVVLEFSGDSYLSGKSASLKGRIWKLPGTILQIPTDIIVPRSHPDAEELYATLSAGLSRLKTSGRLKKILERYELSKEIIESFLTEFDR